MCDEYWEREYLKKLRVLSEEDEVRWAEVREKLDALTELPDVVLPPPPIPLEKKRAPRMLAR